MSWHFGSNRRRVSLGKLSHKARVRTGAAVVVIVSLGALALPMANAASSNQLKLTMYDPTTVAVSGSGFPNSANVTVVAAAVDAAGNKGAGSLTLMSGATGSILMGFTLPTDSWEGKINVTATGGAVTRTGSITLPVTTTASTTSTTTSSTTEKPPTSTTSTTMKPTTTTSTTVKSTTTTTTPTTGNTTADIPGNWKLSFDDEFSGNSLDLSKWVMCNPSFASSCVPYNNEPERFNVSQTNNPNVVESGGQLHLNATKVNGQIMSGMISSGPNTFNANQPNYKPFQYTYGYYEGRVQLPAGKGYWPSMWELPDQHKYGAWPGSGEEDVFEVLGQDPSTVYMTEHDGVTGGTGDGTTIHMANTSQGFHTFGIDWEPGYLKWYVDGQLKKTYTGSGVKNYPFYLIANLSLGGWNGNTADSSTPFPASMNIDWIRVYQHP